MTYAAGFMHIKRMFEIISTVIFKQFSSSATGTMHTENTPEIIRL
jgi:hypothetical protein